MRLSLQLFQLPSFCSARSYQLAHHIMSHIYLNYVASSHVTSCPFFMLGSVFQSVHQVFDVLFYMDAEGQSYDLRQTPLKATNRKSNRTIRLEANNPSFQHQESYGDLGSQRWTFWAHGKVVICPTFGKIDGMQNTVFNLPETNSIFAPENGWSWNTFSFPFGEFAYFQVQTCC